MEMGSSHSSKKSQLQPYAVLPKTLNRTCGLRQIKGHHQKVHSYSWLGEDRKAGLLRLGAIVFPF